MQKFQIGIIKENRLSYSEYDMRQTRFDKEKLEDDLDNYIDLVTVKNTEEMMEKIIKILNLSPDMVAHTTTCKEDSEYIYQLCHLVDEDKSKKQNNICIKLTRGLFRVVGDAVIIKSKIMKDCTTESCSITMDDITNVYQSYLLRNCVKIHTTGEIHEIKYVNNPIDWIVPDELNNIRYHEMQFSDKIMIFFVELIPKNNYFNEKASLLYGKAIYGDVIVAMRQKPEDVRQTEHEYYNLDKTTTDKLIAVFSVNGDVLKTDAPAQTTKTQVNNFHIILDRKYNAYKKIHENTVYSSEFLETMDKENSLNKISIDMINNAKSGK